MPWRTTSYDTNWGSRGRKSRSQSAWTRPMASSSTPGPQLIVVKGQFALNERRVELCFLVK